MIKSLFRSFKWYRKWKGGIWYKNRYIFDAGTVMFFSLEQFPSVAYFSEKEDYTETKQERRNLHINKLQTELKKIEKLKNRYSMNTPDKILQRDFRSIVLVSKKIGLLKKENLK